MSDIMIVGEAFGEHEEKAQTPFVGPTGWELTRLLEEAGIHRADCFLTNVFNLRPRGNKIEALCGPKQDGIPGYPSLGKSLYVHKSYEGELRRLAEEIKDEDPNVIVALGNTACWALLGQTKITALRGTTFYATHTTPGYKVLPTYHPAVLFREWSNRPVVVVDLMKAERESHFREIRRPHREVWIEPTLGDLETFHDRYLAGAGRISIDIETSGNQVTCIGFAPTESVSLVVPFYDRRKKDRSYWPTFEDEQKAWKFVRKVCKSGVPKVFQNGLYDIAFLYRSMGVQVHGAEHDTMLLHHALQPESLKGLGFLGSIYTDEGNWKQMRVRTTIKRDD